MAADQNQGITVDLEAVANRAYARVAALSKQVDQWETVYQAQSEELALARAELDNLRGQQRPAVASAEATRD